MTIFKSIDSMSGCKTARFSPSDSSFSTCLREENERFHFQTGVDRNDLCLEPILVTQTLKT